jgi:hypothetical protein
MQLQAVCSTARPTFGRTVDGRTVDGLPRLSPSVRRNRWTPSGG